MADYCVVNAQVALVPWSMPGLQMMASQFRGVHIFCSADLSRGYWLMPLAEEAKTLFNAVLPVGLYTPTTVPQGIFHVSASFQ